MTEIPVVPNSCQLWLLSFWHKTYQFKIIISPLLHLPKLNTHYNQFNISDKIVHICKHTYIWLGNIFVSCYVISLIFFQCIYYMASLPHGLTLYWHTGVTLYLRRAPLVKLYDGTSFSLPRVLPLWRFARNSAVLQLSLIYFFVPLSSVCPQRLYLNQIIFNKLNVLALLVFLSSVSVLAKVIYIFLSLDWKAEVLLTGKESLLRYNYSIYLPSAMSSIYLSSLSILSSLTLNF